MRWSIFIAQSYIKPGEVVTECNKLRNRALCLCLKTWTRRETQSPSRRIISTTNRQWFATGVVNLPIQNHVNYNDRSRYLPSGEDDEIRFEQLDLHQ